MYIFMLQRKIIYIYKRKLIQNQQKTQQKHLNQNVIINKILNTTKPKIIFTYFFWEGFMF